MQLVALACYVFVTCCAGQVVWHRWQAQMLNKGSDERLLHVGATLACGNSLLRVGATLACGNSLLRVGATCACSNSQSSSAGCSACKCSARTHEPNNVTSVALQSGQQPRNRFRQRHAHSTLPERTT
eukprot:258421-Chlamydomonas_euryale.AAC.2